MFSKEERSTFTYWFAHWCAFQMTALNLKAWKFKYLFHDIEKLWLKLFFPYEKVQKIHRKNNKHHLQYKNIDKIDWEELIIDWECSCYTKSNSPLTASGEMQRQIAKYPERRTLLLTNMLPILKKFKLL